MESERTLSQATKTAARMCIRLYQMSNRTTWRSQPNATERTGTDSLHAGVERALVNSERTAPTNAMKIASNAQETIGD